MPDFQFLGMKKRFSNIGRTSYRFVYVGLTAFTSPRLNVRNKPRADVIKNLKAHNRAAQLTLARRERGGETTDGGGGMAAMLSMMTETARKRCSQCRSW